MEAHIKIQLLVIKIRTHHQAFSMYVNPITFVPSGYEMGAVRSLNN